LHTLKTLSLIPDNSADDNQRQEIGQTNRFKNDIFDYLIEHYNTDKQQSEKLAEFASQINEIRGRILN